MRSRTKRRCGDVYRPIFEGCVCGSLVEAYCASIDEMKALVDPLPLVPAM
jgi:hypothetical protein